MHKALLLSLVLIFALVMMSCAPDPTTSRGSLTLRDT